MLHIFNFLGDWAGRQRCQRGIMVLAADARTFVQNRHHAGVLLGTDGTTKALPQFFLHFGDNFGVYVVAQIRVLPAFVVADRVGYRKRQLGDDQQRHHVTGKVDALPAGACRKQNAVAGLLELLDDFAAVAPCLIGRVLPLTVRQRADFRHLAVRCEQHQRMTVTGTNQPNDFFCHSAVVHEAASLMLCSIAEKKGDMLRYYNTTGTVRAVGVSYTSQPQLIEFYIETLALEDVEVRDLAGNLYTCQVSPHPRGRKISFIDTLSYGEEKEYTYAARHKAPETLNTRHCYMGAEEVRDIVNDYDPVTYRLPYEVENKFFRICYKPGDGITSFVDKRTGTEMAGTAIPFFTPVYQRTPLHQEVPFSSYEERRALGRNIRGKHAETHIGKLMEITCMEHGPVFTQLRLHYSLAGTVKADVLLKLYEAIPRIDFTLELGKTISDEVESVFLSLDLNRLGNETVLRKGAREAFRPGIDQLPGTCMEFYMSDDGAARLSPEGSVLIAARDVPMFYTGEMQHHPIRLCDGAAENNARPLYSWVMNNNWETNFKMDLSGFCQYDYSLWLTDISDPEQAMDELHEQLFDPYVLIVR